jgi:hypothetical protein
MFKTIHLNDNINSMDFNKKARTLKSSCNAPEYKWKYQFNIY